MFLAGLTGGIATGKSTVSKFLQDCCDFAVVDADLIAKNILLPGKPAFKDVIKVFGCDIQDVDGSIDRKKLSTLVFNDTGLRKSLNGITHKRIVIEMLKQILCHFLRGRRFVILDIPLLIETGFWLKLIRHCLVVYCEHSVQLERLMKRNNYSEAEALSRINSQMKTKDKLKFATFVIDNNNSFDFTKQQTLEFASLLENQKSYNLYQFIFLILLIFSVVYFIASVFIA